MTTPQPVNEATGPLAGIRVLDLTGVVFGAYATQILGDMGADVIKVEFPGGPRGDGGDIMRWAGRGPAGTTGMGPIFTTINRNKRSWLLDLRRAEDMAQLRAIVSTCDVFVSSVRSDGLARLGLDESALRALRPQGTVIDLAFYQGGADRLRLGEEFHHNGLNLRCAQINRVPRGLGFQWDRRRLANETIKLLAARGPEIRAQLITHVVPYDEAPGFIARLVGERPEFLQIVFKAAD